MMIRTKRDQPSVFWPTVWPGVLLLLMKATLVGISLFWTCAVPSDYLSWDYLKWNAGAGQVDLLFGVCAPRFVRLLSRSTICVRWPSPQQNPRLLVDLLMLPP